MKLCHISVSTSKSALVNIYSAPQDEKVSEGCSYKMWGPGDSMLHGGFGCGVRLLLEQGSRLDPWLLFCDQLCRAQFAQPLLRRCDCAEVGK